MNKNQLLAAIFVTITGAAAAFPAMADEVVPVADMTGFYGGLAMRERGAESDGLAVRTFGFRVEQIHAAGER